MKFEEQAILLSAESKPYSFEGNEGVSHKIRLNIEGEIYECNSTEEQVASMKQFVKKTGTAVLEITSRKERLSLKLISFSV